MLSSGKGSLEKAKYSNQSYQRRWRA